MVKRKWQTSSILFFANIGTELAKNIPNASKPCESNIKKADTTMPTESLTINEIKEAFFHLKETKVPGVVN